MQSKFRMIFSGALVGTAVALLTLVGGCSVYPYVRCEVGCPPALGERREGHSVVRLFYATDRNGTQASIPGEVFGNSRSSGLKLGTCDVSIPGSHGLGRLESPVGLERPDARRHVALLRVSAEVAAYDFLEELRARVRQSPQREVFVFVHGFATTFDDAARRTAQIAHDVKFDGPAVLYSWPSRGWLVSYLVDRETAEWSACYLAEFLQMLARESGAQRVHVLAHSMGARVLGLAYRDYLCRIGSLALLDGYVAASRPASEARTFGQIVLAAADVDADIFERDYAPYLAESADRVTIYTSLSDVALSASNWLQLHPRLGQRRAARTASTLDRIEVIDVTAVDRGVIGHTYFAESPDVLRDMSRLLTGEPAASRAQPRERHYELHASQP